MYIPFMLSSADGYLGSFLFFSIMNNAPMNMRTQFFFPLNMFSILLRVHNYDWKCGVILYSHYAYINRLDGIPMGLQESINVHYLFSLCSCNWIISIGQLSASLNSS